MVSSLQINPPLPVSGRFFDGSIGGITPTSGRHRSFHLRSYRLQPIPKKPRRGFSTPLLLSRRTGTRHYPNRFARGALVRSRGLHLMLSTRCQRYLVWRSLRSRNYGLPKSNSQNLINVLVSYSSAPCLKLSALEN